MNDDKKFIKLMISYSMIMIIPVIIVSIIVVSLCFVKIERDTKNLNINVLEQVNSGIDNSLKSAAAVPYQIMEADYVRDLLNKKYEDNSERNIALWKIKKNISTYCMENEIMVNVAVYSNINDIIVDMFTVYSVDEYYDQLLEGSGVGSQKFRAMIINSGSKPLFLTTENSILYCMRIKDSNNKSLGACIVTFSKSGILSEFENGVNDNSELGFALFSDGASLLESSEFNNKVYDKISKDQYGINRQGVNFVLKSNSDSIRNLDYVYTLSVSNLTGNIRTMLLIFLVLVFASVGISIFFAKKRMNSMKNIITYMSDENTMLGNNLERQIEKSREQLLSNILHGNNVYDYGMYDTMIKLSYKKLCVMLLRSMDYNADNSIVSINELTQLEHEINNMVLNFLDKNGIVCFSVTERSVGHIYILNYDSIEHLKSVVDSLLSELNKNENLKMVVGIGREAEKLSRISESYEGAESALRYGIKRYEEVGGVVYYDAIHDSESVRMYYTTDKENQLIKSIKRGLVEETEKVFDDIYNINFNEKRLSSGTRRQLMVCILNTMYGIVDLLYEDNVEKHDEFGRVCCNVLNNNNTEEAFEILRRICINFCSKSRESDNYNGLKDEIIEYINKNFKNPVISLDTMATEMGVSYYHLSRLFNEHIGMSFVAYLTGIRLEYSKELLKDESLKIEEVAQLSGFLKSNSFIRVFKKYYNITPGKYRKENI